jgi:sialic acid synthase SpsE
MNIAGREIGTESPVYIIAEAGVNHNGRLDLAIKLIDIAKEAGADAVKFQSYRTEEIIVSNVQKAPYQKETTPEGESQLKMLKGLEIDEEFHRRLIDHCNLKGITFLSTPYDVKSLEMLVALGAPAIKVASTDTTNLLFLEKVAATGLPIILATGMSSMEEVDAAYKTLKKNGCRELAILKCTSDYPADPREVNLNGIAVLADKFDSIIGFSDHTEGVGASPYAVALGAKIIEKHFTVDKTLEGPDHRASLSSEELRALVKEVRRVEGMLGTGVIEPSVSEGETKRSLQKCFVVMSDVKAGDEITRDNIVAKRTGGVGVAASRLYDLLGKTFTKDMSAEEVIYPDSIKGGKGEKK